MERLGFLYDISRCLGCGACQAACKEKNGLPSGEYYRRVLTAGRPGVSHAYKKGPEMAALRSFGISEKGDRTHFSMACNHCDKPACVSVCPTGAMYKAKDGTVLHDDLLCVGCGRCVHACPYGAPSISGVTGYSQKCDACHDRRSAGRQPACVEACRTRALMFGPLVCISMAAGGVEQDGFEFLPDPSITDPSLVIRAGTEMPSEITYDPAYVDTARESESLPYMDRTGAAATRGRDCVPGEKYVILGGGAAGIAAALAVRETDVSAEITIVCDEVRLPYSRPMLSKGSLNSFMDDRYPVISERELEEKKISLMLRRSVTSLDTDAKQVMLADGSKLSYDKCIYALGMECFVPPIPGKDHVGVFTLRTERDLRDIRLAMLGAGHAVIIGGGITGLEAGWEMKRSGLEVTVLEAAPQLLGRILDSRSAGIIHDQLVAAGLDVITGTGKIEILGDEESRACAVKLADGTVIPADIVLVSTGYRSITGIAEVAGIVTNGGIAVNEYLETSAPGVWACGDCVPVGMPNWMHSLVQGRTAGLNAVGCKIAFTDVPEPAIMHTAGTSMLSVGDMGKEPSKTYSFILGTKPSAADSVRINDMTPARQKTEFVICGESGRVSGVTMIGCIGDMALIEDAVKKRVSVIEFCEVLKEKGVVFA